jgi:hypothetical protein
MTTRRLLEPQALQVRRTSFGAARAPIQDAPRPASTRRPCCAGATDPADHHHAEAAGEDAEHAAHIALVRAMDEPGGAPTTDVLDRTAARHPRARPACLVHVGLRRALWRYAALGHLRPEEIGGLLVDAYAEWEASGGLGRTPAVLAQRAATVPRPLAACGECPAPCRVRPLVLGALGGRSLRTREALRRALPGEEHLVLIPAASELAADLTAVLTTSSSKAAGLCMVAHAAQREGLGDGISLSRLRAMNDRGTDAE